MDMRIWPDINKCSGNWVPICPDYRFEEEIPFQHVGPKLLQVIHDRFKCSSAYYFTFTELEKKLYPSLDLLISGWKLASLRDSTEFAKYQRLQRQ